MSNWIIRLLQAFYSLSDSGARLRVLMGMIPLKRRENICLPLFGSRGELIQTCINKKFQMHCCQRWAQTGGKYVFHVIPQLESRVKEHRDITNTLYNLGVEYRTELSLSWIECQINLLLGMKQLNIEPTFGYRQMYLMMPGRGRVSYGPLLHTPLHSFCIITL